MQVPEQLPIVYTTSVLIPGYLLKIRLQAEENAGLLDYIRKEENSKLMIGIIPKVDYEKVDNVVGTVGLVQRLILIGSDPEDFYLVIQGQCRFKLDEMVTESPIRINKVTAIENFTELIGDEKEKKELKAEFQKVLDDLIKYSEKRLLNPLLFQNTKNIFEKIPIHKIIEYCLKNMITLTAANAYEILRATNLNNLLKLVMNWLKQETITNKNSKTGLVPTPVPITNFLRGNMVKKRQSPELRKLEKAIQNSNMPTIVHDSVMSEFNKIKELGSFHPDYPLILNYISYVVDLPWNKITPETLDLKKSKNILQMNHFGMDKVKMRILQFIAVRILNPERRGPILCFIGPPGVGKTTIAKTIAESLNRTFIRVSLGGINSFSDIKGHRKTYIGAMPGCIIQALNQVQTKNPVILLDEIDKMYKGSSGDPAAALLEVLDPEQNSSFVDSFVNLPFDLSQVMFVTTANNPRGIPQTLRDRMEIIDLEGYTMDEKIKIAENYLIPKVLKDHKMDKLKIIIDNETIKDIILKYTQEAGVRDLQRKLEKIYQFIAVKIVENKDAGIIDIVIRPDDLLSILGGEIYSTSNTLVEQSSNRVGIAIGLVWTPLGGKVLVIEASEIHSKDRFVLTGLAGQTLKESVEIAIDWLQSFSEINKRDIKNYCVHIHLPEGGVKKDGPSAGITIVCALVSLIWNIPLKPMIAMTGEVSLKGFVLPVGGVKLKLLAAYNSGIRTVILPELNMKDLTDLPKDVIEELTVIPVKHVKEVLDVVIPGGLSFLQNASSNTILRSKI